MSPQIPIRLIELLPPADAHCPLVGMLRGRAQDVGHAAMAVPKPMTHPAIPRPTLPRLTEQRFGHLPQVRAGVEEVHRPLPLEELSRPPRIGESLEHTTEKLTLVMPTVGEVVQTRTQAAQRMPGRYDGRQRGTHLRGQSTLAGLGHLAEVDRAPPPTPTVVHRHRARGRFLIA